MRKRVPSAYDAYSQLKACAKGDYNLGDYISQLPDEILIHILSFMTLKEAAVTSVLSRSWRYLWASTTCLNFDGAKSMEKTGKNSNLRIKERTKYINWVNRVIRLHKGPTLEEFKVVFDLDRSSKRAIDLWLRFALSKNVQRLVLNLSPKNFQCLHYAVEFRHLNYDFPEYFRHLHYAFPARILHHSMPSKSSCPRFCSLQHSTFVCFRSLTALFLDSVSITQEVLESFLSKCPALESLTLHAVTKLVHLKVAGPSLRLKYLDLEFCCDLDRIEICDADIVSLRYMEEPKKLFLRNIPWLVELSVAAEVDTSIAEEFQRFPFFLSQLEQLSLNFFLPKVHDFHLFGEFTKLKQLELSLHAGDAWSLLKFAPLLKAAPYVQKLVIQVHWEDEEDMLVNDRKRHRMKAIRDSMEAEKFPHQHLKVVEFSGYFGLTSGLDFVMYLIENAVTLETIMINPGLECLGAAPLQAEDARSCAKQQLEGKVPPHINIVIL